MLVFFFILGVAAVVFAKPLGRFKKQIDSYWKVSWASEDLYVIVVRTIGCAFCIISLGILIAENLSKK
jgi:hypothetical protein